MVSVSEIGWASYLDYEGPFFRGRARFRLPASPTEAERIMQVITATEGGHYDSLNAYDSCDMTLGLIQWCDRGQYSVCDMLGHTAERHPQALTPLRDFCASASLDFQKNPRGRWRFFFADERGEVDRTSEQDQLYHLHSSGKKGTWDGASRDYAKRFSAALASVYGHVGAQDAQVSFTAARLTSFVLTKVRYLYDGAPETPLGRCFRAAYLSYAANNPTWAATHLTRASLASTEPRYSQNWLVAVLRELTFGPNVVIYPIRYKAIRPVLERLYGVDLPDLAEDLKQWSAAHGPAMGLGEAQEMLLTLGYDLGRSGPKHDGVDGIDGEKTRRALGTFQQLHGLDPSGFVTPATRDALELAVRARSAIGKEVAPGELDDEARERLRTMVAVSIADMARRAMIEARRP